MDCSDIVPFPCVFIDAPMKEVFHAAKSCIYGRPDRSELIQNLSSLWTTPENANGVLPCLSVRTALDLFLRVMNFPAGSEVIMSAINIPDMCKVIHHHNLKIVSLDVHLETMAPKLSLLESLITEKTKILLIAHLYGKCFDVGPFVEIAHKHNILVVEDLAEAFLGFNRIGHPDSDLALFSFGVIKFCTTFGGAIAKIKDKYLYEKMSKLYETYPQQGHSTYLKKVLKYSVLAAVLNFGFMTRFSLASIWWFGVDLKGQIVGLLRGFPGDLVKGLRYQPSTALLATMVRRFENFDQTDIEITTSKGDYVSERLGEKVTQVGNKAEVKSYWLFPIIVNNPDEVLKVLNALGIDAYRGATQLNLVEPDNGHNHLKELKLYATRYPHEAKYIIDHVIYLPFNKHVPFRDLDRICKGVEIALKICDENRLMPVKRGFKVQSKL